MALVGAAVVAVVGEGVVGAVVEGVAVIGLVAGGLGATVAEVVVGSSVREDGVGEEGGVGNSNVPVVGLSRLLLLSAVMVVGPTAPSSSALLSLSSSRIAMDLSLRIHPYTPVASTTPQLDMSLGQLPPGNLPEQSGIGAHMSL